MWHADAKLELRLGVHTFGWLQVRGVGTLDGTNHPHVKITPGAAWCARLTGWTRPHGGMRGPDAPAVQSGQKAKSHQTLAMALEPWGHGYNAEQASVAIMHGSCMLSAFRLTFRTIRSV